MTAFKKPLPGLYSTVVQELLVQQHLFRWNKQYQYSPVSGGGGGVGGGGPASRGSSWVLAEAAARWCMEWKSAK